MAQDIKGKIFLWQHQLYNLLTILLITAHSLPVLAT
jgi:hypothetical protein